MVSPTHVHTHLVVEVCVCVSRLVASPPLLCSLKWCHSIFFLCGLTLALLMDGALPPPVPALKFGTCIPPFYLVFFFSVVNLESSLLTTV